MTDVPIRPNQRVIEISPEIRHIGTWISNAKKDITDPVYTDIMDRIYTCMKILNKYREVWYQLPGDTSELCRQIYFTFLNALNFTDLQMFLDRVGTFTDKDYSKCMSLPFDRHVEYNSDATYNPRNDLAQFKCELKNIVYMMTAE